METINDFWALFSYDFVVRGLVVGVLFALCAALLGVNLVLGRYSMIGDGLSHVGFGALSLALVLGFAPMMVALPVVMIAAFFLLRLQDNGTGLRGDSAIAMVSVSALAGGVLITSLSGGISVDVTAYLFGSILAISPADAALSISLSVLVLVVYSCLYRKFFAITFDGDFAKASGMGYQRYRLILAMLTALTVVVGMRLMGTLLISGLLVFPGLSVMRLRPSFRGVVLAAGALGVFSFLGGMMLSFWWDTPVGASVVMVSLVMYLLLRPFGRKG